MITVKKVAQRAGVSPSTVSRVLSSDTAYVSPDTRKKVLEAVAELHYVPNANAQRLRNNRTYNIALLIPDICNDAYPPTIQGIEEYARKKNYNIILCITQNDLEIERYCIEKLKHNHVDGFLICSMTPQSKAVYQLKWENIPTVLVARHFDNEIDAVIVDNYEGAFSAVKYLVNIGKKRIALISGNISIPLYQQRLEGYKDALRRAEIDVDEDLIVYETWNKDALYQSICSFLETHQVDAIFAANDEKAIIAMRAVNDCGLSIPGDVAVLGFDNIRVSKLMNPPLSTIAQPFSEMGRLATQRLIEMIEQKATGEAVIDVMKTELIVRSSTE